MSDNLGAIETDMPDDIQQAVERGQKIAAGRVAYNKWLLTGVWDGDVAHLLEYARAAMITQNSEADRVVESSELLERENVRLKEEIEELKKDVAFVRDGLHKEIGAHGFTIQRLRDTEAELRDSERRQDDLFGEKQELQNDLNSARDDIEALVRTVRLLSRRE